MLVCKLLITHNNVEENIHTYTYSPKNIFLNHLVYLVVEELPNAEHFVRLCERIDCYFWWEQYNEKNFKQNTKQINQLCTTNNGTHSIKY